VRDKDEQKGQRADSVERLQVAVGHAVFTSTAQQRISPDRRSLQLRSYRVHLTGSFNPPQNMFSAGALFSCFLITSFF
jgi:hypothetical protein